jgi:hypothetical protein
MSSDTLMQIALQLEAVRVLLGEAEAEQAGRDLLALLQQRLDQTHGLDICTEPATVFSRSGNSAGIYEAVRLGSLLITTNDSATWLKVLPADRLACWEREVGQEAQP